MAVRPPRIAASIAAVVLVALSSCDRRSPTSPIVPPPGGPTPAPVIRIELLAPSEIEPDESVQLTANAVKSDGSVENVTSQSQWSPTSSQVLQISPTGLATGRNRGEVFVSARYSGRSASKQIFVLPRGTFRLNGFVKETGFGIGGVTVSVASGTGQGLSTITNFVGGYALYGVSGPVQLQTQKDGYVTGTHALTVTNHGSRDLEIVADRARADYRGTYALTISLASPCRVFSGVFPDALKRRTYTATVEQEGGRLSVTLSDAEFVVASANGLGRNFSGFADLNGAIRFTLGDAFYYYYYYGGSFAIAERIDNDTLLVSGVTAVQGSPGRFTGVLDGAVVVSTKTSRPFAPFVAQCHGPHGFEMVRR
jgi:hypothetical protein